MKATHTGRLKRLDDVLLGCFDNRISASWLRRLSFFTGKEVNLILKDDGHYSVIETHSSSLSIELDMLTNIREIKPVIEIPKGDFWFKDSKGATAKCILRGKTYSMIDAKGWELLASHNWFPKEIKCNLNDGTWTICEAPEKKMIPWSDGEFIQFILDDGWICPISEDDDVTARIDRFVGDTGMVYLEHLSVITNKKWSKIQDILPKITDRHGNKFEKEA